MRRVVAAWDYGGPARALVLALKLRGTRVAAGPLAAGMALAARRAGLVAEVVTWVPGRRADRARRGFDHGEELARAVAGHLGLPARGLLRRTGRRPDQTALSRRDRKSNLVGAFVAPRVSRAVLLVDDLVTTGATAAECASALEAGGAPVVELLVACRA